MQRITVEIPDSLYQRLLERAHASEQNAEETDTVRSFLLRAVFEMAYERSLFHEQERMIHLEALLRDVLERLQQEEKARSFGNDRLATVVQGIASTPDVNGGEPCIIRTRIPVWTLVRARQLGLREADILQAYPTLNAEDLVNAWHYAELHSDTIASQIAEDEAA